MKKQIKQINVDEIYEDLKEKLVGLTYKPGEHLSTETLIKHYEATEEAVGEALNRLIRDGFIVWTKTGARVVTWEANDVEEIQELSLILDRLVLEDIFELDDRSILLKELGIISDRFMKADSSDDQVRWAELFSKALYRSIGSQRLLRMASTIKSQQAMLRNILLKQNNHVPQLEEHRQIVAGIEKNDFQQTLQGLESAYALKTQAILKQI
ncbi:MAG: GntR family transcriptional regulator [Tissierellia bacterium]|nr:GntR family transcriptional regulator [Tissierellia bacterium]